VDRELSHPFGSQGYAREELRAEIASMIVGSELGIGYDPSQHAAYAASWITLARIKAKRALRDIAEFIAELSSSQSEPIASLTPKSVCLMQTVTGSNGAQYSSIAEFA